MLDNILCKDNKCPICESGMRELQFNKHVCSNGCYSILNLATRTQIIVFGQVYIFTHYDMIKKQAVLDKIRYWKENDRYLAEILERN